MTGHRNDKETDLMPAQRQQQVLFAADRQQHDDARDRRRLGHQHPFVRQQRPRLENQYPGQQIKRERQDPQQGSRRHVGRDMRGHRDQKPGRDRGKKYPARTQDPGRRRRVALHRKRSCWQCRRAPQQEAASGDQDDQQAIAAGPDQVLRPKREDRLRYQRIGQQREKTADIGRGVEKIGIGPVGVSGADKPGLQQRIIGCEREKQQANRGQKQAKQPQRIARGRRFAEAAAIASGSVEKATISNTTCTTIGIRRLLIRINRCA